MDKQKLRSNIRIALIIFLALALAITYFFLFFGWGKVVEAFFTVADILRPIIIGAVIAYLLKSTCNGYEKLLLKPLLKSKRRKEAKSKKIANITAVVLTYITWGLVFSALLWIVVPQIIESITKFVNDLIANTPGYVSTVTQWINTFKAQNPSLAPSLDAAWIGIQDWAKTELVPKLPSMGGSLILGVVDVFGFIADFGVGLVISVFFLSGRKAFAARGKIFIHAIFKENHANAVITEFRFADKMFGGFLEGKIIDSAIVGIVYYIALEIMGIQYPGLLAVICGVTNIIPFFGPFLGAIPSGIIILMSHSNDPLKLVYFIIFVCVVQFLDGNILDPHIVGGNIKIAPFYVIFAVLLFGGLWGFAGMILGVPLFAVIYDILKKILKYRLKKVGKYDMYKEYLKEFKPQIRDEAAERFDEQDSSADEVEAIGGDVSNDIGEQSAENGEQSSENSTTEQDALNAELSNAPKSRKKAKIKKK